MLALLAVSLSLAAPVPGPVARPFAYGADPFQVGWHRGADFRARPGAMVRAACSGRVAWAGQGVVTVRCGAFRVTHLPLARVTVAGGARVRAGARIGTLARSRHHAGLHLGVRRASDRFGYVDPLPLLAAPPRPMPAAPPRIVWPRPAPPQFAAPPRSEVRVLAPWPAWLGLAVLLAGAVGGGLRIGVRRRRATVVALARR